MYEQAKINVTLTASIKSLKEQAKVFIDKIVDDLKLIETQEHKAEIIEEEKRKQEEKINPRDEELTNDFIDRTKKRDEVLQAPKAEQTTEDILILKFTVKGTRSKLKALKEFLENGGYDYE